MKKQIIKSVAFSVLTLILFSFLYFLIARASASVLCFRCFMSVNGPWVAFCLYVLFVVFVLIKIYFKIFRKRKDETASIGGLIVISLLLYLFLTIAIIMAADYFDIGGPYYHLENKQVVPTTNIAPEGTCNFTTECTGTSPTQCVKDWLARSNCLTSAYVDDHIRNFQEKDDVYSGNKMTQVKWDFMLEGQNLCYRKQCYALVGKENGNYFISESGGVLKQYAVPLITKNEALKNLQSRAGCSKIKDVNLYVDDRFDGEKSFDEEYGILYDKNGLVWEGDISSAGNMCGKSCFVNAYTGEIIEGEQSCI